MDEMRMEKWWNEICGRGKREKPREKPTQTPFRPPPNPHGGTETRTWTPAVGGEHLTACAPRPPVKFNNNNNNKCRTYGTIQKLIWSFSGKTEGKRPLGRPRHR